MKKTNSLKSFLKIEGKEKDVELCSDYTDKYEADMEKIKMLLDIAMDDKYILYFDGKYVDEVYDGYEFEDEAEEFFYYNAESFLVFMDDFNFKVRVKIRNLKNFVYGRKDKEEEYKKIYNITKKAVDYTKSHPYVSEYKLFL